MNSRTFKSKRKSYYHITDRKNVVITINNEKELVKGDNELQDFPNKQNMF